MNKQVQRFVVKFVNGFWVTFDSSNYENTHLHTLRKDAESFTKKLNGKV